jgi:hypothetical protein
MVFTAFHQLDTDRQLVSGIPDAFAAAIAAGADMRVGTQFKFNEHVSG